VLKLISVLVVWKRYGLAYEYHSSFLHYLCGYLK